MHQPRVLRSALHNWQQIISECALRIDCDAPSVADLGQTMALGDYVETLESIARQTGISALGWKVGQAVSLSHFGEIWKAVDSSQTLGAALRRMCGYFDLLQDLTELRLIEDGDFVALSYRILDPTIWPRHQDAIYTLAIKARILFAAEGFCPDEAEIYLETSDQCAAAQLERASGMICHAGADTNMIRFPARLLGLAMRPTRSADPAKMAELARLLRDKKRSKQVEDKVRATIYSRLGRRAVSQSEVATEIGLSDRTLRRQLAARNTSFQKIVDDCRIRQAVLEITRCSSVSISEIALRLGYSEHSTFSRAFSRCTGVPPQNFLRQVANRRDKPAHGA